MALFTFDKKNRLGIDIGTASIKIVELTKEANRFQLVNYGMFELEPEATTASLIKLSNADMVAGIKSVLDRAKIKTRHE